MCGLASPSANPFILIGGAGITHIGFITKNFMRWTLAGNSSNLDFDQWFSTLFGPWTIFSIQLSDGLLCYAETS